MPFEIVRNDITRVKADVTVNTANTYPVVGSGVDAAIYRAAGEALFKAREEIGRIAVGEAAVTPGFDLPSKWVIHTVAPTWRGGFQGEELLLRSCYEKSLALAADRGAGSVAFPLIAAGNEGFPPELALRAALEAISDFLLHSDMQVTLVVFDRTAWKLSEELTAPVRSFIDENYVVKAVEKEYGAFPQPLKKISSARIRRPKRIKEKKLYEEEAMPPPMELSAATAPSAGLDELLRETDAGFQETLLKLIDRSGRTDADVYKKANVDRKLFSKIRGNIAYRPSKTTALAFAVALELDVEETRDLLMRAGFALSKSSKLDIIVEYFLMKKEYDILAINAVLFDFDQPLLGGR